MIRHIRIVSPSGHLDPALIDQATVRLRSWGYSVSEGKHARDEWGRFAGTDEARLKDLCEALKDPTVDLILCSRGGYGLQRIIDRVPPITKPILGFSDITALHMAAGLNSQPTLHGIMCKHIATLPEDSEPIVALRNALKNDTQEYTILAHPLNRKGTCNGPIIGGNLSVLYGLQATQYDLRSIANLRFQIADCRPILLIEDVGERHYHIDRMMRNLRMSGVLGQISGLIVGQFSDCEDDPSMPAGTIEQTIYESVADYHYPVVFGMPVGHVERNLPIWFHRPAQLIVSAENAILRIAQP